MAMIIDVNRQIHQYFRIVKKIMVNNLYPRNIFVNSLNILIFNEISGMNNVEQPFEQPLIKGCSLFMVRI